VEIETVLPTETQAPLICLLLSCFGLSVTTNTTE